MLKDFIHLIQCKIKRLREAEDFKTCLLYTSPDPGTFLKRADPAPEMPYHPLHPSGPHSHLRKRHYMEVDLALSLIHIWSRRQAGGKRHTAAPDPHRYR